MPYVAINAQIYVAAFSGSMSGIVASERYNSNPDPASYDAAQLLAGSFAEAVDTAWNDGTQASTLALTQIESICFGAWQSRYPVVPPTLTAEALAIMAMTVSSENYFTAQGLDPGTPGGGGSLPPVANILGATIVENPAGVRVSQRLRQSMIDPNFAIASWAKTAPNGGTQLYRRGDVLAGYAAAATYTSGPATSASVASVLANGLVSAGAWAILSPFAVATKAGTVTGDGTDVTPDPTMVSTLTANDGSGPVTAAFATTFTSDGYVGVTPAATPVIVGTDVYNGGDQPGFTSSLKQTRNQVHAFNQVAEYAWFLWPDRAPYTTGAPTFKDQNGFAYAMIDMGTTTILRNGLVQTYRMWRSAAALSSPFTVTVT